MASQFHPVNHRILISSLTFTGLKDSVAQIALKQKRSRQMVQKAIFGFHSNLCRCGTYYEMGKITIFSGYH